LTKAKGHEIKNNISNGDSNLPISFDEHARWHQASTHEQQECCSPVTAPSCSVCYFRPISITHEEESRNAPTVSFHCM